MNTFQKALPWILATSWTLAIFMFSSPSFSANNTGGILETLLAWGGFSVSQESVELIHLLIRKGAHLTVYGLLSVLWSWALHTADSPWRLRDMFKVLIICGLVASLDEYHQSGLDSRTGSPVDVCIDLIGASLMQLIWGLSLLQTRQKVK